MSPPTPAQPHKPWNYSSSLPWPVPDPPVHIGLNLVFLVPGETGGMEVYARELIAAMVAAAPPGMRFTSFINREAAGRPGPWHELTDAVVVPVTARRRTEWVRGEQQILPRLAARAGCHLVHSLASTAPLWGRFRRVVTIHDLNYRLVPEAHLGRLGLGMRVLVPAGAHRSDRIIVDSESTRQDLLRSYRLDAARIDTVALGVRPASAATPTPERELRARHDLGERALVLCVSAQRPHKNLLRLVEALAALAAEERPILMIVGYETPYGREVAQRAATLGLAADVRLVGWVGDDELEGLYAFAAAFVFPSLYEGFGLPVLEAMARGVPVATTDRGSLPEVAGDAALTFDPLAPEAIAAALRRLLTDAALAERLREAGRARAAQFSWAETAHGTLAAYGRTLGR